MEHLSFKRRIIMLFIFPLLHASIILVPVTFNIEKVGQSSLQADVRQARL